MPSPCSAAVGRALGRTTPTALAIDLNPVENPYVGCGMTRNKKALSYLDRSRHRPGTVTSAVVAVFFGVGRLGLGGS